MTSPAFRPRSVPEIIDAAAQLTRRHFGPLMLLAAVSAIPSLLLTLASAQLPSFSRAGAGVPDPAIVGRFPLAFLSICWLIVANGALMSAAAAEYLGEPIDPGTALRQTLRRAGSLVGANVLVYLMILGLLLVVGVVAALVLPKFLIASGSAGVLVAIFVPLLVAAFIVSLFLLARYSNVSAVVLFEDAHAGAALGRSVALTRGFTGRAIGLIVLTVGIFLLLSLSASALIGLLVSSAATTEVLSNVAMIPLYPLMASIYVVFYYDLRIRKEGYDIELLARALERPAPSPSA